MNLMEEALEPQDIIERTVHQHHEMEQGAGSEAGERQTRRAAVAAAILAVFAALGSLLSGHAANEAILDQTRASDEWAYYQAKNTNMHLFDGDRQLIFTIAGLEGKSGDPRVKQALKTYDQGENKFSREKTEIERQARHM